MNEVNEAKSWSVIFSRKAEKQKAKLPADIAGALYLLQKDLEQRGPIVAGWPNYGKIAGSKSGHYHCHLNKGRPTYVVVWQVLDKVVRVLEIQFAGTHEKVDYSRYK